ncbi:hypothetical protein J6590_083865 [Homalodisca vitripennis]|nr:hypothetical protein J6590_083865 [Homalodisca vitripennis]
MCCQNTLLIDVSVSLIELNKAGGGRGHVTAVAVFFTSTRKLQKPGFRESA